MAGMTLTRKLQIIAQVVSQQAGRSQTVRAVMNAGRATARSFRRVLHQLWLEVTGFVFLAMAGVGGIALSREYVKYQAGKAGPGRMVIAVCFCLTFGYFGLSSFWRVRRKRQS
jgi:hypothetical protein